MGLTQPFDRFAPAVRPVVDTGAIARVVGVTIVGEPPAPAPPVHHSHEAIRRRPHEMRSAMKRIHDDEPDQLAEAPRSLSSAAPP